jgi:LAO/AO transport system kinase
MLEASGYEVVIIETVGVGQSELAIAKTADTTILVLMPGSGDDIQAIKSGIMEIGDIFVVNKGDLPGANKSASEITQSLELNNFQTDWRPPVIVSVAETGQGVGELWESCKKHKEFLQESNLLTARRSARIQAELSEIVADIARRNLKASMESADVRQILNKIVSREIDPHTAAESLLTGLFGAVQA